jgi:hypothetical protein
MKFARLILAVRLPPISLILLFIYIFEIISIRLSAAQVCYNHSAYANFARSYFLYYYYISQLNPAIFLTDLLYALSSCGDRISYFKLF